MARLYDSYLHLLVPSDSPIHRLADLAGRHVAVGAGAELVADRALAAAGIDAASDITRAVMTPGEAVAALRAGHVDAFLLLDGVPSPDLATLPGRLVDLADVANTLLGSSACPTSACAVYRAGTVPAASYRGLAVAITTVAVPTLLLTTTQASPETVGQFTRLVFDSAPRIAATVPAVRQIDRHTAIFTAVVPLHEGAKAYYRATKLAI
ncbi:MAG: TAXI family TRAP transporter solute-binding subunit [Micromonosporaceae bacterium]|nr:TAXI family TRAP transporter solute-binding subunit [Micromonosporaceae bacterium]